MNVDFHEIMSKSTDEQLLDLVENRSKYAPEAISAAIAELEQRGHVFAPGELDTVTSQPVMEYPTPHYSSNAEDSLLFPEGELPHYYSSRAIFGFSVFFAPLLGAILLAKNLAGNGRRVAMILMFGIAYEAMVFYVLYAMETVGSGFSLLVNGIGGAILAYFFWPRYLGKETQYISKSIWPPLMIGLLVSALCLIAYVYLLNFYEYE